MLHRCSTLSPRMTSTFARCSLPWLAVCTLLGIARAQTPAGEGVEPITALRAAVVQTHTARCHALYSECLAEAKAMQTAIAAMLREPSVASLATARAAWTKARFAYCRTETLRFCDGPIEPLEPLLNAWPVDEAYIDYVQGNATAGIVHDREHFPQLSQTVLTVANERSGEANISVGWHAIEFLLWGQDLRADGAGDRPFTDYVVGKGPDADRRREYLTCVTDLLVQHLQTLVTEWAPGANNYRRRFEADDQAAIRRMLTGALVLTAFELAGERLAVAYETKDQEQEHSCFSDTSCQDFVADQLGIVQMFQAGTDEAKQPGLLALIAAKDAPLARSLHQQLESTLARMRAIPSPFDVAMRGADDSPGRLAIRAAMDALDAQAELLAIAGQAFGFELPVHPGGR